MSKLLLMASKAQLILTFLYASLIWLVKDVEEAKEYMMEHLTMDTSDYSHVQMIVEEPKGHLKVEAAIL